MKKPVSRVCLMGILLVMSVSSALAVDLKKVVFARRLGEQMEAIDPGNRFPVDATVYLSAVVDGRPKQGKLICRFYYRTQLITEAGIDFAETNKGLLFSIGESTNVGFHLKHDDPFPVSPHFRAELFLDGRKLGSYPFLVVPPEGAAAAKLHAATLSRDVDDEFKPVDATDEFATDDTVHLAVHADVGLSTWVQADWFVDGKHDPAGTRSLTFQENAKSTGLAFSFIPRGGWPKGSHHVVLTVNDEELAKREFSVAGTPPEEPAPKKAKPRPMKRQPTPSDKPVGEPQSAAAFNARGEEHFEAERFDEALADFNRALKLDPGNAEYMSNRGWVFYQQDDPDTALLEFEEAVRIDSTLTNAYWGQALIYSDDENWSEAIRQYSHAIRHTTDATELAELYTERGKTRYFAGDTAKALRDFERAVSRDPEFAWAYANRGELLIELEQCEEAVGAFRKAIEIDQEIPEFHNLLGQAHEQAGETELAVEAYTGAILLDLDNITWYQNRARVHERNGDLNKAVKDLKRAITIDPEDAVSHNNLALLYGNAEELDAAIEELNTALELDDQDPIFWYNRGDLRFQNGDAAGARDDLTQSLKLDDQDPDAWALRGRIQSQLGDDAAAAEDYSQAVKLAPDTYQVARQKYLRIANQTDEKLHVWVQYFIDDWYPEGAADEGTAARYEFVPDEEDALIHDQAKIRGSRFRIWAVGLDSGRQYVEYRGKDYVVVPDSGYITTGDDYESAVFTFTPGGSMAPEPDRPKPTPSPAPTPDDSLSEQPLPRSSTIHAVAYGEKDGKSYGVCFPVEVTVDKNPTQTIETAFTLSQSGSTWRAAGWMATVFAADTLGYDPLATQVNFATSQNIDGPSAGGLMTVGVLATLRGDPVRQDAAMTGIINPDGTIGPVGGIPHKMEGAAATGKKLFLTPYGKRYEQDKNAGKPVDLFAHGRRLGLEVHAVGDVYSAYELLTGVRLPRPEAARAPQLDVEMYNRVVRKVVDRYKQYESLLATWNRLPRQYRTEDGSTLIADATKAAGRVDGLLNEGLAPAAFQDAIEAAQGAAVAVEFTRTLQTMDQRGIEAGKSYVRSYQVEKQWKAAVTALRQYQPQTLSGVGVVMHGYSTLLQGMACQEVGERLLDGQFAFPIEGSSAEKAVINVLLSSAYLQIAQKNYENIAEVLDIAGAVEGRAVEDESPYFSTTMFFKNAAVANMNQFEQVIVNGRAEAAGVSFEQMQLAMMQFDKSYLITRFSMDHALPKLLKELDEDPALIYAHLGSALQVYVMASRLLTEYYSLSVTHDDDGNVTGIVSESPLKYMLDFSEDQVRRNIQVLRDHDVEPMSSVFFCQVGSSLRSRELKERLGALTAFWQASVQARTLAYLGGFAGSQ